MTPIERIRTSWSLAAADAKNTGRIFYSNLFRIDPSTKPLFVGDLELQVTKLTDTLAFIVDHLEEMDTLLPVAEALAKRHVGYGVTKDQYSSVGSALIATFKQLLGSEFSKEDEDAWVATYTVLSNSMIEAAYKD